MSTKITKSELKQMICEALREELHKNRLLKESSQTTTCPYVVECEYKIFCVTNDLYAAIKAYDETQRKYGFTSGVDFVLQDDGTYLTTFNDDVLFLHQFFDVDAAQFNRLRSMVNREPTQADIEFLSNTFFKSDNYDVLDVDIAKAELANNGKTMVKAYITYFDYDHEKDSRCIYDLTKFKANAVKNYKDKYLPNFLLDWPDDVSTLILQEICVDVDEYNILLKSVGEENVHSSAGEILDRLYRRVNDTTKYEHEILELDNMYSNYDICAFLIETGECSSDLAKIGVSLYDFEPADNGKYDLADELMNNPDIHEKAVKAYIARYY